MIPAVSALPSDLRAADAIISLPCLKRLTLLDKLSRLLDLWSHLSIPPNTAIQLGVDYISSPSFSDSHVNEQRSSVFPALLDHLERSDLSDATALYFKMDKARRKMSCVLYKRNPGVTLGERSRLLLHGDSSTDSVFVGVHFYKCAWGRNSTLERTITSVPASTFAKIDTLQLDDIPNLNLVYLLERLPRLNTLVLNGIDRDRLMALSPFACFPHSPQSIISPVLAHLYLTGVHLCDPSKHSTLPCARDILELLSSRKGVGQPLHSITFERSALNMTTSELASFNACMKKLVHTVRFLNPKA
ncbi:unnamed protein product [Peniophora sp. CBMAI 1063]|nr:unnamed protein product [Peniophora sp. CBMAI 1063]